MEFVSNRALRVGVFTLLLAAVGCGDDTDDPVPDAIDTPVNVTSSVRAKCEALSSALCNREAECGRPIQGFFDSPADEQAYVDECERINHADCGDVVAVSTSFGVCLSAAPRAACVIDVSSGAGFSPSVDVPSSCADVLLID